MKKINVLLSIVILNFCTSPLNPANLTITNKSDVLVGIDIQPAVQILPNTTITINDLSENTSIKFYFCIDNYGGSFDPKCIPTKEDEGTNHYFFAQLKALKTRSKIVKKITINLYFSEVLAQKDGDKKINVLCLSDIQPE